MSAGPLVVTYPMTARSRAIVAEELGGAGEAIFLADLPAEQRAAALSRAGALLAHDTSRELRPEEIPLIGNARLLQFTAAGIDWVKAIAERTAKSTSATRSITVGWGQANVIPNKRINTPAIATPHNPIQNAMRNVSQRYIELRLHRTTKQLLPDAVIAMTQHAGVFSHRAVDFTTL